MPATTKAQMALDRYEAAERATIRRGPPAGDRAALDAMTTRSRAARDACDGVGREVAALNSRIGALVHAKRVRSRSVWYRLFAAASADADRAIETLRHERVRLQARQASLQRTLLQAEVAEVTARRKSAVAAAQAGVDRAKSVTASRSRLAVIERARVLLTAWPALAYLGIQRLIARALCIEKARDKGWDPGPGASDMTV